jgi:ferredoxin/flavodoxin---NADP+ reductase
VSNEPLRVAVVGSGPAGFYAADALLKSEDPPVEVDLIDRLPTPWGLVRLGVAPDHENIKAVSRAFEKTAARPGFRFFGNVEVGSTVSHAELVELYDAVVYTVGAQTDRRLEIPGEDLPGSFAATEFVAWYNGHPDFQDREFDLSHERAIVIGNGNVAIDCARMLALTPEELAPTDTTHEAIDAIVDAGVREIVMLGRRGPVQAAFTPPELKELGELGGAEPVVDPADLRLDPASEAELEADRERARRNFELLEDYAAREPEGKPRRIVLRFLVSPVAILGEDRVEAVEVVRNELVEEGGRIVARPTGETEIIPAGIVLRSVGYRGVELPGVPFDERSGTIPNERGRVAEAERTYVAGWIKRGPSGVIGTNKKDAVETVELLLEDARAGRLGRRSEDRLSDLLEEKGAHFVEYAGWQAIDAAERGAGEPLGRPRVKLTAWEKLLETGGRRITR